MADEAITTAPVDAPAPAAAAEPIEPVQTNGDTTDIPKEDEETAGKQATPEVNPPDGEGTTEVAEPPSAATVEDEAETTPASGSKKDKRKSVGGVPEHKSKKLNRKKSMPTLHLDCQPGEFYWARLKGYPPWPAVICDEQMLPESLLASRPVSTTRPDGSLRDDFKEGGKNAKERTFPIMFLATNEFTWMVNTSLTPLDPAECTALPSSKMTNALKKAWQIASESHDLAYFKGILKTWQEEQAQIEQELREQEEKEAVERERREREEAEEAEKAAEESKSKKKSKSRKSKGGDDDVEMEDADAPKSSKKRKTESDADGAKPKKTPKVTKLNAPKTPNGEASSAKKSSTKSKKKVVQAPKEDEEDEKPQMTEAEKMQQREKSVLYLRHRLQKGFLSRDQAPQEAEMAGMADFISQLEGYENLEPSIIRATKVHKVLKAIVKLSSIPKDELYNFKKRSAAMLEIWNKRMEAETESAPASAVEPKADAVIEKKEEEEEEKTPETNGEKASAAEAAGERVVPVPEAKEEGEAKEGAQEMEDIVTEAKAEAAAEQLDEKVETVVEDNMDVAEEPPAASVEKTTLGNDAKDEATDGDVTMQPTVEEVADAA